MRLRILLLIHSLDKYRPKVSHGKHVSHYGSILKSSQPNKKDRALAQVSQIQDRYESCRKNTDGEICEFRKETLKL